MLQSHVAMVKLRGETCAKLQKPSLANIGNPPPLTRTKLNQKRRVPVPTVIVLFMAMPSKVSFQEQDPEQLQPTIPNFPTRTA